jgi:hypothetical protein
MTPGVQAASGLAEYSSGALTLLAILLLTSCLLSCPALSRSLPCVSRGGVVDGSHQGLLLTMAALGPEEVNQVRLGPLTPHAVRTLRTLRDVLGVTFDMKTENESRTIFLTCIGSGIKNLSKKVT